MAAAQRVEFDRVIGGSANTVLTPAHLSRLVHVHGGTLLLGLACLF